MKTTSKGWRVGDRVAWSEGFGAVIIEVGDDDVCFVRFDDDSQGWHALDGSGCDWRRIDILWNNDLDAMARNDATTAAQVRLFDPQLAALCQTLADTKLAIHAHIEKKKVERR